MKISLVLLTFSSVGSNVIYSNFRLTSFLINPFITCLVFVWNSKIMILTKARVAFTKTMVLGLAEGKHAINMPLYGFYSVMSSNTKKDRRKKEEENIKRCQIFWE